VRTASIDGGRSVIRTAKTPAFVEGFQTPNSVGLLCDPADGETQNKSALL
jgi:hypothetical protein